ncbi:MAG: aldo/keto reductase family protein [Acetobacteraceae bacterium]
MSENEYVTSIQGVRSPRIIYGTAWKKSRTQELVSLALRHGFRGIDTAGQPKHYHEAGVGAGIAAALDDGLTRAGLYLQTKFTPVDGQDPKQMPYDRSAAFADQVAQSFRASLQNLRTDYVDCLVLHSPLQDTRQLAEVWSALEAIVEAGGARQLGISNCYSLAYLEALRRSARIPPAVVQNRFYAESRYDREIRAFCRDHGIIYQGFWTLTANPHILAHEKVKAPARKHRRTPAQILFRWLTQEGVVPLTGTTSEEHMQEDLGIFDFDLSDEERAAIAALF